MARTIPGSKVRTEMLKHAKIPQRTLDWIAQTIGSRSSLHALAWMGRSSTEMHAVDIVDESGQIRRLALRRYVDVDRLVSDPWYRPEQEAEALRILAEVNIPAPRLIAEDVEPRWCDVPTLLETRISGRPLPRRLADFDAYLQEAAELLCQVHAVTTVRIHALPNYAPYEPLPTQPILGWSSRPALWARVLDILRGPAPYDEGRFIHRDYHPGNILVANSRIAGIVDWPTACRGPRSIDLARMRLNLVGDCDLASADRFLALYRERAGSDFAHEPYWDLVDAIDLLRDEVPPRTRRQASAWQRFEEWVARVVADLK